jgi:Hydrolase of X-linked nucleoside diphosphate N terminal
LEKTVETKWLEWAQKLQAMSDDKLLRIYAQNGLTYSENPFDIERYKQLRA